MFWLYLSKHWAPGPQREPHRMCQASKQRQQHCTQNRGLFLWTVPVHLEVLFPSQQCGQKRPLVSLGPREDFCVLHPAHQSAWVTVPPFGYRGVLQPHFNQVFVSCWTQGEVRSCLSATLGIYKWGMNMEQRRERCWNCQAWINSAWNIPW